MCDHEIPLNPSEGAGQQKGTSFLTKQKDIKNDSFQGKNSADGSQAITSKKTILGLLIVVLLAISWVGAQQFSQSAVTSPNFKAPYFTVWFSTCWMSLCFPIYAIFLRIFVSSQDFYCYMSNSLCIFGPTKIGVRQVFTRVFPFNVLWVATNYLYVFALTYIAATDASAILSSNVAVVYILSFFLLGELFYFSRFIASLFCISGVVLFGYADGFQGGNNLLPGILMAVGSAIGSAVYKVLFKRALGEGKLGQVSLFLTLLGLTNALFLWIVFLILFFTNVEAIKPDDIPWSFMCGSSALSLVFNFLVNFGVAFTYPLFISVAMVLGIPLNAAVDLLFRDEIFSALRLVAAFLLIIGFALMMLPDHWNLPLHRLFPVRLSRCYGSEPQEGDREQDQLPFEDKDSNKANV